MIISINVFIVFNKHWLQQQQKDVYVKSESIGSLGYFNGGHVVPWKIVFLVQICVFCFFSLSLSLSLSLCVCV